MGSVANPFAARLADFSRVVARRKLGAALAFAEADVRALTGVACDNACLLVFPAGSGAREMLFTDFRYAAAIRRTAPWLKLAVPARGTPFPDAARAAYRAARGRAVPGRIGFTADVSAARYLALRRAFRGADPVDLRADLDALRAVKTPVEIEGLAAAAALNLRIWNEARRLIRPGFTEKRIQRTIRALMNGYGDGEAFETIVCAGANAAECHHVPDDTVWKKGDGLLVDMGVKLAGYCSDMTRCLPAAGDPEYAAVYDLVAAANRAAIAAAKPGMTCAELDAVARGMIRKAGYGRFFGHALGHGVGFEIHESPALHARNNLKLKPGMAVTIEPGVYLEGRFGVRIEDLVLITRDGCEVLSAPAAGGRSGP